MKSRLEEKTKAIALRKQGLSYRDILKIVPVSKSSLSGWFKLLNLTEIEEGQLRARAASNVGNGRERAALSNRENRLSREKSALEEAQMIFEIHREDPIFILGIGLYWAEGSKRTSAFQLMNSDPSMISFMIFWVQKYLGFAMSDIHLRLTTHEDFKYEKYEDFWSQTTGIPIENFRKTVYKLNRHGIFKKNPNYKGCARLEVDGGMKTLRMMLSLQKILGESLKVL